MASIEQLPAQRHLVLMVVLLVLMPMVCFVTVTAFQDQGATVAVALLAVELVVVAGVSFSVRQLFVPRERAEGPAGD